MKLKERVRNILVEPRREWEVIAGEDSSVGSLYRDYIVPLAAIGPLALLVRVSLMGVGGPEGGPRYASPLAGAGLGMVWFALSMASVFIVALVVDALAPSFGARKDPIGALKVAAYASTPTWLVSVLVVMPVLAVLYLIMAAGFYGIYLLYLGLPPVMGAPRERALAYTVVVIIVVVLIQLAMSKVAGMFLGSIVPTTSGS